MSENKKYNESEWLYATARVRALEKRIPDRSGIERLLDARDVSEMCAACSDVGLALESSDTEKGLRRFLASVYAETCEMAPDPGMLDVMRFPNDAHNIKAALKCSIVSRDPAGLLIENGTVDSRKTAQAVLDRKFDLLPGNMGAAAKEALEAWATTRDPQYIDQLVDAGCALDKKANADEYGDRFTVGLVELESDLTNVLICIRITRMTGEGADTEYLHRMLLPGGSLGADFFVTAYNDGEPALWAKLASTRYSSLAEKLDSAGVYTLSAVERSVDDMRSEYMTSSRFILAGPPALISYIDSAERFVKNVRIIIAGKQAGEANETIRERLRGLNV